MFLLLLLLSAMISGLVSANEYITTTTSYDLEVPGSDPIRIIEGEPLWDHNKRSLKHSGDKYNQPDEDSDEMDVKDSKETTDKLKKFLNNYADKLNKRGVLSSTENYEELSEDEEKGSPEKSKSWSLLNVQNHKHPFEDKKGWISMEPVPWSVAKISKWQPNKKPNGYHNNDNPDVEFASDDRWDAYSRPGNSPNFDKYHSDKYSDKYQNDKYGNFPTKYQSNKKKYDVYYVSENSRPFGKPPLYEETVHIQTALPTNYNPFKHTHSPYKEEDENCNKNKNDIITDGLPPNFPSSSHESIRRRGTDFHPESHPSNGDGEWVLLSTTKGYKYPRHKERSLKLNTATEAETIGTHRGVRLTVLPPLKNSKVNMTTSHGGLLQVESTFETVEQSRNKLLKRQKLKQKQKRKQKRRPQTNEKFTAGTTLSTAVAIPRRTSSPSGDSGAVLAAVGAGMIPATMAMLVPMAMSSSGRKRRSTRLPFKNNYFLHKLFIK